MDRGLRAGLELIEPWGEKEGLCPCRYKGTGKSSGPQTLAHENHASRTLWKIDTYNHVASTCGPN